MDSLKVIKKFYFFSRGHTNCAIYSSELSDLEGSSKAQRINDNKEITCGLYGMKALILCLKVTVSLR